MRAPRKKTTYLVDEDRLGLNFAVRDHLFGTARPFSRGHCGGKVQIAVLRPVYFRLELPFKLKRKTHLSLAQHLD